MTHAAVECANQLLCRDSDFNKPDASYNNESPMLTNTAGGCELSPTVPGTAIGRPRPSGGNA